MDIILQSKLEKLSSKIGNTDIVLVDGIFCKLEGQNPAGSIKDRVAFYMVKDAIESGALNCNGCIVEATSGNTGIGLAYIARELGIKCAIVMPESMSKARREMIASYGATLYLTPASQGMQGAVDKANELCKEDGYWLANQFGNPSCISAHYLTTAKEIFDSMSDVSYIVAGIGSGGTVMGIKKFIIDNAIDCKVIGIEPSNSPLITKGYAGAHKIQGIGANFIPSILDIAKLDGVMTISDEDAISTCLSLNKNYLIPCGISSGATFLAAKELNNRVDGKVLAIFADSSNRYSFE